MLCDIRQSLSFRPHEDAGVSVMLVVMERELGLRGPACDYYAAGEALRAGGEPPRSEFKRSNPKPNSN